ncbi:MAG: hypothetical protein KF819_17340 [Labilithrix sp.]|nr:hypothetical protein [Labilithrix sp.]
MKTVRPKPLGAPDPSLRLTPEEDFVLSRIDGNLSVHDLVALTGMEGARVEQIVNKLARQGAVALEADSSGYLPADPGSSPALGSKPRLAEADETASLADFAAALGMDPSAFVAAEGPRAVREEPIAEHRVESRSNYPPPAVDPASSAVLPAAEEAAEEPASTEQLIELGPADEVHDDDDDARAAAEAEPDTVTPEDERNYRKIYETRFHRLPTDQRVHLAQTSQGPDLYALCLDADARIIAAILENPTCGLQHVRLIAFHHRTGTGLEMISRRAEWIRDILVERRLLRNPQCGEQVLGRIMSSKRLFQTYKIAIDREIPELTRSRGRGYVRTKWQNAAAEERADLIIRTEARCLTVMIGCNFDAKTTGILCGRQYNSVIFIQNLAKFAATPPGLLAHLIKQPFVRKIAPLRKLLLQHPNMPGEVKRQM